MTMLDDILCNKTLLLHSAPDISETIRCARYIKYINCSATPTIIDDVFGLGNIFYMINPNVSGSSAEFVGKCQVLEV